MSVFIRGVETGLIVFVCVFGSALVGMPFAQLFQTGRLPMTQMTSSSLAWVDRNSERPGLGSPGFHCKSLVRREARPTCADGADLILLDRSRALSLSLYGSETKEARGALHDLVADSIDQIDSLRGTLVKHESSELRVSAADFYQMVQRLSPASEEQKSL